LFSAFQFSKGTEILKKYLNYYNNHPVITKTGEIISDLNYAKDAVIENVEKLLERDNKMDIIVKKSDDLQNFSTNINSIAKTIRKNETQRKNKFIIFSIIIVGVLIAIILLVT
jgi:t-SNARE complex subunit (syntaxin)